MIRAKLSLLMLVVILALPLIVQAKADIIQSTDNFNVRFLVDEQLQLQDVATGAVVTFQPKVSNWNATCSLATTDLGGTMIVTPGNSGSLLVTANMANITIQFNGVSFFGTSYPYATSTPFTITWGVLPGTGPPGTGPVRLPTLNVKSLWQYLIEGDLLGFIQAIFLFSFNSADLLYGVLAMLFCIPIYIRTKSLIFLCIIWIILGGFFIALMPIVSGIALLFMALGIGGLIFKLVRSRYN